MKQIYAHGSKFAKSDFYSAFGSPHPHTRDMFSEQDIKRHSEKRRAVASLYSLTTLLSYEPFVDAANARLCERLAFLSKEKQPISVPQWMQFYAFDVIGEITVISPAPCVRETRTPLTCHRLANPLG